MTKIKNYIENAEKEWEQEILNKIIPPTADVLVPDMDSRGMRERAKSFITSKLLGLLEVVKEELPAEKHDVPHSGETRVEGAMYAFEGGFNCCRAEVQKLLEEVKE